MQWVLKDNQSSAADVLPLTKAVHQHRLQHLPGGPSGECHVHQAKQHMLRVTCFPSAQQHMSGACKRSLLPQVKLPPTARPQVHCGTGGGDGSAGGGSC